MDFLNDVHEYVLSTLPYDAVERPTLAAKSAGQLLIIYLNWLNRLIPARPRTVRTSQALKKNPIATKRAAELAALIAKIETGGDLRPHLSKDVRCGFQTARKGKRRRDLDLMLNEWQVHHLHLSGVIEADGFVTRDNPLLFAVFTDTDAYLIDIYPHRSWTKDSVAHTLIDEWSDTSIVREIKGIVGVSHQVTPAERAQRRKAGINSPFISRNGKFYAIGHGGITSAASAILATMRANHIIRRLREIETTLSAEPHALDPQLIEHGITPSAAPDFHFAVLPDGVCGVTEKNSSAFMPIAQLF